MVGGSGRIGSRAVTVLTRGGHDAVAASRRSGIDAVTGEGLAHALRGASVVVDVSDSPAFDDASVMTFFTASTRNLLACAAAAGVGHHVMLSIVGIDRVPEGGYYHAKVAQEELIKDSSVRYTIVRATQFFEFLNRIAGATTHGSVVRAPPVLIQPIAADDVARAMAELATGTPLNGTVERGGPEPFYLSALMQWVLAARMDPREVVVDPHVGYFGAAVSDRSLVPGGGAKLGETPVGDWLRRSGTSDPHLHSRISDLPPGSAVLVGDVAVFNVARRLGARQARCTHRQGPLSQGTLDGSTVTCPLHGLQFDVRTGAALRGRAQDSLRTYAVTVNGDVGRFEVPLGRTVQGA